MKIFGIESKKLALWLVAIFAVAALISGIFLLTSGLPRSIRNGEEWPPVRQGDETELVFDESREFPVDGLKELVIRLSFENAVITAVGGDVVTIRYHGTARPFLDADEVFFVEQSGGLLTLESRWGNNPVQNGRITLDVGIPADALEKLTFNGASGHHDISGLNLITLDARAASGNISVRDISAETALVKASSGNVTAENWSVGSGRIGSSSGSLKLKSVTATGTLELNASSGRITGEDIEASVIDSRVVSGSTVLKGVSGNIVIKSSSGSVDVDFRNPGNSISINVSSGGIDLGLPAGTAFTLDARATSGNIRSDFPVAVSGSMNGRSLEGQAGSGGSRTVTLKSSSGNIRLKEIPAP